jgi:hypothetical protein
MTPDYGQPPTRIWLLVRPDPEGPWHLHASEDHHGRARTACGRNILPADALLADLAPSCETCLRTRLWRAILAWEPDDETE